MIPFDSSLHHPLPNLLDSNCCLVPTNSASIKEADASLSRFFKRVSNNSCMFPTTGNHYNESSSLCPILHHVRRAC